MKDVLLAFSFLFCVARFGGSEGMQYAAAAAAAACSAGRFFRLEFVQCGGGHDRNRCCGMLKARLLLRRAQAAAAAAACSGRGRYRGVLS